MLLQIPNITPEPADSVSKVQDELSMLTALPFDELVARLVSVIVNFSIHLCTAILVFYLGRLIISRLYKFVSGIFVRRHIDQSLATFVLSMVRIVLYFILIVIVIGILGINTSSFIALFASAGVAIGMALSGTLQNFAGGVLILLLKPYKIGDFIEAQGYSGVVREIQIFSTIICTPDNKSIIIPNGGLSTGMINNYNKEDYRRVDWIISISYGDDVDLARSTILGIVASDSRIVKQYIEEDRKERKLPPPEATNHAALLNKTPIDRSASVVVDKLAASSVDLKVTAWVPSDYYWGVYYELNERFYKELPTAGIRFPFPQMDVHVKGN